ncbi:uracil-DNA glycosylase [candidate division WOR-3 bacterium]|uniref:Type-4 uracil-DNA glycosylase n=1 Tax=candidate division WOR-3 bacterium TaxID=2052148 RepID=A0A660SJ69_UNCW3|nr:MAG: uracil-DNA glycosylase [candidate division WOR-3 bacterium]
MVRHFLRQKLKDGEDTVYLSGDPLHILEIKLHGCRRCRLVTSRRRLVFGEGNPSADLILIGEAPGKEEDKEGRPFIGRAGRLLREMLTQIGLSESDLYITNVVKCHPPYDRDPKKDEISACLPYLKQQIRIIQPRLILTLGRIAASALMGKEISITKIHGKLFAYEGIRLIPTFHPAFLIRNPNFRPRAVKDLALAKELIYG